MSLSKLQTTAQPYLLSILRIVASLLFIQHGARKLFGIPAGNFDLIAIGNLFTLVPGLAGLLEFFGGILLLLGLFSRPVAFVLSGEMAFAYFMAHLPNGFYPIANHGGMAIMFCFTFLYIAATGPGPWSLDRIKRH